MTPQIRILQAVTSLRVGDGAAVGAMDLPLARERHTRWPFLPGSSLKGALRLRAELIAEPEQVARVFGSPPPSVQDDDDEELVPGTLRLGQATLLALPVRSLHATFALLTCPTALARFGRAIGSNLPPPAPAIEDACIGGDRLAARPRKDEVGSTALGVVFLEDLDLVGVGSDKVSPWAQAIRRFVGDESPVDHLVVVHDDVFAHACRAWTEHRTRNRVGKTGVVEDGALFSVELAPAETLWWVPTSGGHEGLLPANGELFQLGGHQSVGMGRAAWYGDD